MSNAAQRKAEETGIRLDAAAARRQFSLSLGAGLALLMALAMFGLQPSRAAVIAPSVRHAGVSAPQFAVAPVGLAELRRAMTTTVEASAD